MEKLNMQTADAAEENIRRIAGLFPGCVTETISKPKPLYAVVREPKDDATMTNFDELFKTNSPDTHRHVL